MAQLLITLLDGAAFKGSEAKQLAADTQREIEKLIPVDLAELMKQ